MTIRDKADAAQQMKNSVQQAHDEVLAAADGIMLSKRTLDDESETAALLRLSARQRMIVAGLSLAALLKAVRGKIDQSQLLLKQSELEYSRLAGYADSKGYDLDHGRGQ